MTVAANEDDASRADSEGSSWLAGAWATLRARWWLVAAVIALCLIGGIVYLRNAEYRYTAALRVAPAPTSAKEAGSLGALTSLATLTGATLEAIPVTPFRLYVEGFFTREVANRLAGDPVFMRRLFAEEWDARTRRWRQPESSGNTMRNAVYGLIGVPVTPWSPPDAARLQAFLGKSIAVAQTPKTPVVVISMDSADPDLARMVLVRLHETVDGWLRERTLQRTRNNIAYLNSRLPTVTLADHRQALFATLSDQEQRQLLARNPAAYAAERFGNATVSPVPTSPRQVPILAAAVLFGALLGVALALLVPRRRAT